MNMSIPMNIATNMYMSIIMNTAAPADPGTMNTTTKVPAAAVMSMTTSRKIMTVPVPAVMNTLIRIMTAPVAAVMTTAMRITTEKRLPA